MANIPGTVGYVSPDVFSRIRTIQRAVSIPGGLRVLCIMGLGQREETVLLSAQGGGADGVNPDFTGSNAPDGRHFELSKTDLIAKRTTLYLDGIPLTGVEEAIDTAPFNSKYDYRLEPLTGRVELQRAHLVDQGGSYVLVGSDNVGSGTVSVELIDANAPTETWTIRCTSVIRDAYGDPIAENAVFTATGSESGQPVDAYGAPVVFISDGAVRDNGILRLTITEGGVSFERGDRFTVKVDSRVMRRGQTLEARYIATEDLNDPEFFTDANALFVKHGLPSVDNTLSLGAAMAYENGAFGVLALQAKPPIPRRTSEVLLAANDTLTTGIEGFPAVTVPMQADLDAFMYTIDSGAPDTDAEINFMVIDADSGDETQIFPNKVAFYSSSIATDPWNNFVSNPNYVYSYTVILSGQVEDEGTDGEVLSGSSAFTADSASFAALNLDTGEFDTDKQIRILSKDKYGNDVSAVAGTYDIVSVGGGIGDDTIVNLNTTFTATESDLVWELVDAADLSPKFLFTKDLINTIGRGDGIRISYVDQDDAAFFDSNWAAAYDALETADCQIVVPLPNAAYGAIQQAGVTHVELMSNATNKKERMLLTGAPEGVTADALIGREEVAVEDIGVIEGIQGDDAEEVLGGNIEDLQNYKLSDNFGTTFRCVYFFPDQIVRVLNGTATTIPGFYMAAAAGGRLSATANPAIPLTRKVLTGFSILRNRTYKQITLNELGNVGAAVVVPVVGGGQILHGKTTVASGSPEEEEISIVFIRDRVADALRSSMRGFIGQPEDPTLAAAMMSKMKLTLQALTSQGLITDSANLSVVRDEVDPRQWNLSCAVQPSYPTNWLFIDISVGLL